MRDRKNNPDVAGAHPGYAAAAGHDELNIPWNCPAIVLLILTKCFDRAATSYNLGKSPLLGRNETYFRWQKLFMANRQYQGSLAS
jgi:hypothetical protein